MKYIKTFEAQLKYSDPKVINHKLKFISDELLKIVKRIKEIDNFKRGKVRVYFEYNGSINITYSYSYGRWDYEVMFKIILTLSDRNLWLGKNQNLWIIIDFFIGSGNDDENCKDLMKFIKNNLSEYIRQDNEHGLYISIPLDKLNNILDEMNLNDFHMMLDAKKYNL